MKTTDEVLNELLNFVRYKRESGDNDLRTIIWAISELKNDNNYKLIDDEDE